MMVQLACDRQQGHTETAIHYQHSHHLSDPPPTLQIITHAERRPEVTTRSTIVLTDDG